MTGRFYFNINYFYERSIRLKYRKSRIKQIFLLFILLAFSFSVFNGCASMPSFPPDTKSLKKYNATKWKNVSDREIFVYSELIMKALLSKADFYRYVRKSTTTIGVLAAAFGTGIHGAFKADADTLTMVAGVATVMPLLQHVWKAGEASRAQEQGIRLIGAARAKFLLSIGGINGKVNGQRVTVHGATLFDEVNAAVTVVRDAIAQTVPSLGDLKTAMGEATDELKIKVVPKKLNISTGTTAILSVINGYAVNAVSSDNSIVTVVSSLSVDSPKKTISIKANTPAPATITIIGSGGGMAEVTVNAPTPPPPVSPVPPGPAVP